MIQNCVGPKLSTNYKMAALSVKLYNLIVDLMIVKLIKISNRTIITIVLTCELFTHI